MPTSTRLVARELGYVLGHAGAVVAISGASTTADAARRPRGRPARRCGRSSPPARAGDGLGARGTTPPIADDSADPGAASPATTWPTSCTRRARPAGPRAWSCATATSPWCPTALPRVDGRGLAARVADVHVRRHRVHLQPDEARACGCSTCRASTSTAGSTSSSSAGPTATFLVPAMAELLIASPRFDDADLSSITICPLGSAPVVAGHARSACRRSCPTPWSRTRGA